MHNAGGCHNRKLGVCVGSLQMASPFSGKETARLSTERGKGKEDLRSGDRGKGEGEK